FEGGKVLSDLLRKAFDKSPLLFIVLLEFFLLIGRFVLTKWTLSDNGGDMSEQPDQPNYQSTNAYIIFDYYGERKLYHDWPPSSAGLSWFPLMAVDWTYA